MPLLVEANRLQGQRRQDAMDKEKGLKPQRKVHCDCHYCLLFNRPGYRRGKSARLVMAICAVPPCGLSREKKTPILPHRRIDDCTRLLGPQEDGRPVRRGSAASHYRQVFWLLDHPTSGAFPGPSPVASCRFRPQLQRRDRDGFAPSSLLTPSGPVACL